MKRKMFVWLTVVMVAFAIFLPLYYIFSADKVDGLESTLEHGDVAEGDEVYTAPLSYGENYVESLAYGVIGIVIVFAVFYAILLIIPKKKGAG